MARVKLQDIPPEFAALYKRALGETRPVANPGTKKPGLLDAVCKHFPETLEPPHVPTQDQLEQRAFFLESIACFNNAPTNERFGYWQLSLESGLWYYDFYHQENIPRFINGETCEDISRPYTTAFLGQEPLCPAWIRIQYTNTQATPFHFDATLDPATYTNCDEDEWGEAFVLVNQHLNTDPPYPHFVTDWIEFFNPTERTRYTRNVNLPNADFPLRWITFYRYSFDPTQAVTWNFDVIAPEVYYMYENWSWYPD